MSKKLTEFQNFGEYLYYAYANLQMLHYALKADKPKYDRMYYMIRAKAFKTYKEGRWNIHNIIPNILRFASKCITLPSGMSHEFELEAYAVKEKIQEIV